MQRFTKQRPKRRIMDAIATPAGEAGFDPVTGLAGRERFHLRAEDEWTRRAGDHSPMTLVLVDIDRFEAFRGVNGPEAADHCLNEVGKVIAEACRRRGDFAGRVRDHNFAVLLSEATPKGGEKLAEQIRKGIERLAIGNAPAGTLITASVSVASAIPKSRRFVESLLTLADSGLATACDQGGNCVVSVRE